MGKGKKALTTIPDPSETIVEIHLPPSMYDHGASLFGADPNDKDNILLKQLIRAVFQRDNLYGITKVRFIRSPTPFPATSKAGKGKGPFKDCDVTMGP